MISDGYIAANVTISFLTAVCTVCATTKAKKITECYITQRAKGPKPRETIIKNSADSARL